MIGKLNVVCSLGQDASYHLALERTLEKTVLPGEAILFFWSNYPCVVIGNHQNPWRECNFQEMKQRGVTLVRRSTGGGAVYQDEGNLNVSLISREPEVEGVLCFGMKEGLMQLGIQTLQTGRNDLVLPDGRKFCGTAYSNRGGILLEHACLLVSANLDQLEVCLRPSEKKKASKGVESVRQRVVNLTEIAPELTMKQLIHFVTESINGCLRWDLVRVSEIPEPEDSLLETYQSYDWNMGSRTCYELELEDRFSWGEVQIQLSLKKGRIISCRIYTDALDDGWVKTLEEALPSCTMEIEALEQCLSKIPELTDSMRQDLAELFI